MRVVRLRAAGRAVRVTRGGRRRIRNNGRRCVADTVGTHFANDDT
jgi:hypothetical protein